MTADQKPASREEIEFHYDVGNDFYRLWLDPGMNYSCARWEDGDDLATAQYRKNLLHIEQAAARNAKRVLDVGCGWGGLLELLGEVNPHADRVGLTLSEVQLHHCAARLQGAEIRLESWEDHSTEKPYDAIFTVGALEHFVSHHMSHEQRIEQYKRFFRFCANSLTSSGRMSLQTIAYGNLARRQLDPFIYERIFPNSDLPSLEEIAAACRGIMEIQSVRNDRLDYAKTCQAWAQALAAQSEEACRVTGRPELVRDYIRYLKMSAAGFSTGALTLLRIALTPYATSA